MNAKELYQIAKSFNEDLAAKTVKDIIDFAIEKAAKEAHKGYFETVLVPSEQRAKMLFEPSTYKKEIRQLFEAELEKLGFRVEYSASDYLSPASYSIYFDNKE